MNSDNAMVYYKLEDVQKNNGKNGNPYWLVVKNCVCDVTEFRHSHPGGEGILVEWAGKDATMPFAEVGHSSDANDILKQLKIGEVAIEEGKSETSPEKPAKRSKRSFWSILTGKKE